MFDVKEKGVLALQAAMAAGEITSQELTLQYMQRIAELDRKGPAYHAVIEINPDAVFLAQAMDRERAQQGPRGPLHGIPILVKDNICTRDKMHTSAGSVALADNYATDDAFVIKKLRQAGAVLLGKTNMSEFARYMATNTVNGYSSRGGQVVSPYRPGNDVSGSSSGSGVAASVSFSTLTIGTETDGSIVAPASANGVVGLKPTVGLVSRSGIIPINSQDTAGPMGRTVEDCAIALGARAAEDGEDPATWATRSLSCTDYTP
ncbi:MAG: amidase family protein, partial [Eubacteriales bacterium]|nr:amidase family protein [Eubacteriales bacterium]